MTTTRTMSRRQFALTAGVVVAIANADVPQASVHPAQFSFYDARFPQAIAYGLRLGTATSWRPIDSDAAAVWQEQLHAALSRDRGLRVEGITAASVPFCLEILARECAIVRMTQHRIDRGLIHWMLEAKAHG